MTIEKRLIAAALVACVASLVSSPLLAQESKGKILIVLSSEHVLPLKDGKTFETGYYLNELTVPAQKFAEAGYELVFADPKGNVPAVDQSSISTDYFGGSQEALESAQRFQGTLTGLSHPLTLREVAHQDLRQYKAIFVPGGPAPMIDLMANDDLGSILRYFHAHHRTTVLLCHGPIALLSATRAPAANQAALRAGNLQQARSLAASWPYRGYKMTVFSDEEESIAAKNVFHAEPLFTPQQGLETAGGKVSVVAGWKSNVLQDRELITGQNPASDAALADLTLQTLSTQN